MRKASVLLSLLAVLSFPLFAEQHIVRFANGVPADFAAHVAALGGSVVSTHPLLGVVDGLSAEGAAQVGAIKGVAEVQPDMMVFGEAPATLEAPEVAFVSPDSQANPTTAFFYPRQWHLRAIGAQHAWAAGKIGSNDVTVAILDSGVDGSVPDLQGRLDLSRSKQFQLDTQWVVDALDPDGFTYLPTDDLFFHGTHVAATVTSNALVAAGVTSNVTLIAVKVLGLAVDSQNRVTSSGSLSNVLSGVLWAADQGADVANMSLGSNWGSKAGLGQYIGMINGVFNYAHRQGMLVVVSAGNSAIDMDHDGSAFKAYCGAPNVVCVSATGPTATAGTNGPWANIDALSFYSNYGRSAVDVAAPGGNSGGSVTAACSKKSLVYQICATGNYVLGSSGTSMAAPHVSGLAALLVEKIGKNNPAQVKAALLQGADDLGQPGTDAAYGKGRINVPRSLGLQ